MQNGAAAEAKQEVCLLKRWRRTRGPSYRPLPDTLPRKTLLAAPLRSDELKYALATDQSCLESDKPPVSGPAKRGK